MEVSELLSVRGRGRFARGNRAGLFLSTVFAILATFLAAPAIDAALVVPTNCQVDPAGANDRPGQRDVTQFCVDNGNGAPWELHALVGLDEIRLAGANTIDACAMFNLNGDAFVDLAVCVTLRSRAKDDPATDLGQLRLFSCSNKKADKCMNPVLVPGPYNTACEVTHTDTDPFGPAAVNGPGDDYPWDTRVVCALDLDDFGLPGAQARLMDSCSYPSTIPNSDADDCILYAPCDSPEACDDGNACSLDVCDPSGVCMHAADDGVACSDGLFCTGEETCNALGFCPTGSEPLSCDDGIACTVDDCDELGDGCVHDPRSSLCDDGLFCTGVETCDATDGCQHGPAPDCSDSSACTLDACDMEANACVHTLDAGACDDGEFCNGQETCDPESGCIAGTAPDCSDGVACTEDACDESIDACAHEPVDAFCSDGAFCNGAESCDPDSGCTAGVPPDCRDAVACTADACDEASDLCTHVPDNRVCDNGEFCDGAEVCDGASGCRPGVGPCQPPLVCSEPGNACVGCLGDAECDNGVFCDGAETCNVATGTCVAAAPVACDDDIPCTTDSCNETTDSCSHSRSAARCDNGLFCDGIEQCDGAGGCMPGVAAPCDDGIACTVDSCIEATDRCRSVPDDGLCDNGRYCDGEETCSPTVGCEEGEPVVCNGDRFNCSTESCDPLTDTCESDFSRCVCGDREILAPEECEPPARAGTFEDCNNLIDDDRDGAADCDDNDCQPGSGRGTVCDESCRVDRLCARVGADPASIVYNRRGGPDSLWVHGRFPIDVDPDPVLEGLDIQISNDVQPIFLASLGVGDLEGDSGGVRFEFRDNGAKALGAQSSRGGLARVSIGLRWLGGVRYLTFRVRAYGDFSEATRRLMTTQIAVGGEVASLTEEWSAAPRRWYLRQKDF